MDNGTTIDARRGEYEAYQQQCAAYHQDSVVHEWFESVGHVMRTHRIQTVLHFFADTPDYLVVEPKTTLRPDQEAFLLQVHRHYCEHVRAHYPLVVAAHVHPPDPNTLPFTYRVVSDDSGSVHR